MYQSAQHTIVDSVSRAISINACATVRSLKNEEEVSTYLARLRHSLNLRVPIPHYSCCHASEKGEETGNFGGPGGSIFLLHGEGDVVALCDHFLRNRST